MLEDDNLELETRIDDDCILMASRFTGISELLETEAGSNCSTARHPKRVSLSL